MFPKSAKSEGETCCDAPPGRRTSAAPDECSAESCAVPATEADAAFCPVSGTIGLKVDLITVKALLNSRGLSRLDGKAYRFCQAPDCDAVYFDNRARSVFRKGDLTVRVGQKETEEPVPICYCFGYSVADLRRDLATRGKTDIPAIIAAEIQAGHCACAVKNPQGTCCLGNVSKLVKRVKSEIRAVSCNK